MEITKDIRFVGVDDHDIDLFEGQYVVPNGMAYNSYVIVDEKTAVMDTVDGRFVAQWLERLSAALEGHSPAYLVVQHMEPDHSAGILEFLRAYPDAELIANARTLTILRGFFGTALPEERIVLVKDGETVSLGRHTLRFIFAPMVHWPEVMVTYDETEKVLFSADAFGKFGASDTLTREQFFKIMANFMKVLEYPRSDTRSVTLSTYYDGGKVADWAQAPTRLLIYIGAVTGDGKNLNPTNNTSIQEAIAVFLRCYKYTMAWKEEHPNGEPDYVEPTVIEELIAFAKSFEGYPYVYGGNGPNNFDCSGFVLYVYKHFGYSFSRGAQAQYNDGMHVKMDDLKPGDLVFFSGNGYSITHVGLYLGDGKFIHAANPSRGVVIDNLWGGYYTSHFWGGCRIILD